MSARLSFAPICGHKKTRIKSAATPSGFRVNTRDNNNEFHPNHQTKLTSVDDMISRLIIDQRLAIDAGLNINQACVYHAMIEIQHSTESVYVSDTSGEAFFHIPYRDIGDVLPVLSLKKDTIYRHVKHLENIGLVERLSLTDSQVYEYLSEDYSTGCLFCGYNKFRLHDHHYPVRKADGGTETISLCPNCHSEFHALADYELVRAVKK